MVKDIKIDASHDPRLFRKAFAAAVGAEPLPEKLNDDRSGRQIVEDIASEIGVSMPEATRLVGKVMQREILTEGINQKLRRSFNDKLGTFPSFTEVMKRAGKFSGVEDRTEFARRAIEDSRLKGRPSFNPADTDPLLEELTASNMRDPLAQWIAWADRGSRSIGNPQGSIWHKISEAYRAKKIILGKVFEPEKGIGEGSGVERAQQKIGSEHDIFFDEQPQIILVEHNWAAAFAGAQDFSEGEYPLPYERCAFEFMLDNRHVVVLTHGHRYIIVSEIGNGYWVATIICQMGEDDPIDRYEILFKNIRAICIALDAEVAITEVVRAPHRLNRAREKQGKLPINDHHVINLARRSRVEALPTDGDHEPRWHPRLHFRRGHWRHYDNHKTWIKWMLVGDPDLGFIDKEYRA